MFGVGTTTTPRSSSADAMANANNGGLLQEFRKKTLFKMSRYTSAPSSSLPASPSVGSSSMPSSPAWEDIERQEILEARTRYFLVLMKRFQEQDCSLRQLEAELGDMLVQIQSACGAMTRAVEVFTQTFRYDASSYKLGVDYLAAVKMIGRDGANMMDQSIRFTVLDPILARLERHNQLKARIQAWEQLYREYVDRQLSVEQMKGSIRSEKDERRRRLGVGLAELQMQLAQIQDEVTPQLEETTDAYPAQSQVQLFGAMRLQLAMFFFHANRSLVGGLSETESEIVQGIAQSVAASSEAAKSLSSSSNSPTKVLVKTASSCSDKSTELETEESYPLSGTSEEEEPESDTMLRVSTSSITLEEFESGKCPPDEFLPESECTHHQERCSLSYSEDAVNHTGDIVNLLELASNPVLPDYSNDPSCETTAKDDDQLDADSTSEHTDITDDASSDITRSRSESGMLASFRKSFQDKLGTSISSISRRSSTATQPEEIAEEDVASPSSLSGERYLLPSPPPLSSFEWKRIEGCLWEIDRNFAPSPAKPVSQNNNSTTESPFCASSESSLQNLAQTDTRLLFECASYLRVEEIALLAKTNKLLHATIANCPSVWKQSIRTCGLTESIRSGVWLSILYGTTPWQSDTTSPHHLSGSENRTKIYEQLLMKVGTRMANANTNSMSEEDAHLLHSLQEIDVDVARTCNKDIFANDMADDWSTSFGDVEKRTERSSSTESEHSMLETLTLSVKDSRCVSPTSQASSPQLYKRRKSLLHDEPRSVVQAKIRRILRAYVTYNPRVGYCQGMNFLVRVLIEVTENEADVFWLFVGLSEPEINRNLYEPGLVVLQPLLAKFELLVSYHMPELYVHFQREGVHAAAFTTRWFMTMFSSFETFGPTLVLRVLDMFVIDGWRSLLSMGLVVLDELREVLLHADLENILRILQFPRNYMVEPDHSRRRQLIRHALAFCTTRAINTM